MLLGALFRFTITAVAVTAAPAVPKPPFHDDMKKIFSASDETWELYKASKQAASPAFPSKRTNNFDDAYSELANTFSMPISNDRLHGEPESKAFKSDKIKDLFTPVDLNIKPPQESVQPVYIRDSTIVSNQGAQRNPVGPVTDMASASIDNASGAPPITEIKEVEKSHRTSPDQNGTVVSDAVNPPVRAAHGKLLKAAYDSNTPDPEDGAEVTMDKINNLGDVTGLKPVFQLIADKGTDIVHGQGIHVRDGIASYDNDRPLQGTLDLRADTYPNNVRRASEDALALNR